MCSVGKKKCTHRSTNTFNVSILIIESHRKASVTLWVHPFIWTMTGFSFGDEKLHHNISVLATLVCTWLLTHGQNMAIHVRFLPPPLPNPSVVKKEISFCFRLMDHCSATWWHSIVCIPQRYNVRIAQQFLIFLLYPSDVSSMNYIAVWEYLGRNTLGSSLTSANRKIPVKYGYSSVVRIRNTSDTVLGPQYTPGPLDWPQPYEPWSIW